MVDKKPELNQAPKPVIGVIPHSKKRHLIGLGVVVLVVIASLIWVAVRNNQPASAAQNSHFLYTDAVNYQATITDASNKVLSKTAYPATGSASWEASTPKGSTLISTNITTDNEDYSFIKDGKTQSLPPEAVKALSSTIVLDSRHQVFFSNETTLAMVVCPTDASCKLETLDITSGKTQLIADTGVKARPGLAPAYLLGLSNDHKIAYLRVIGKGTLSKSPGALYQIDLKSHKVVKEIEVSQNIGYSVVLSPDKQKLAYKSGGYNGPTTIHVLDLTSYKDSTVKWDNGQIADLPSGLVWSADSSKVLLHTQTIVLPPDAQSSLKEVTLSYLDVSKMTLTTLSTFQDPSLHSITADGWADNNSAIYQLSTASDAYNFTDASVAVYKLNISNKQSTKIQSYGSLNHVIYW